MGLDMYLSKKTYVKRWEHNGDNNYTVSVTKKGKEVEHIKPERVSYIEEEIGYWRKANQIHNWFVENVQNGEDNCRPSYVDREKLKELLELCEEVMEDNSKAEELLPTASGFFFGGTEYDEWYFKDIEKTIQILKEALKEERGDFYYEASW